MVWLLVIASVLISVFAVFQVTGLRKTVKRLEKEVEYRKERQHELQKHLDNRLQVMARFVAVASRGGTLSESQVLDGRLYANIEVDDAWQILGQGDSVVVDVREPHEYATGHIPGALLLPVTQIEDNWRNVPTDKSSIIVHCAAGTRSAAACRFLSQEKGFTNLLNLAGGLKGWPGELEKGNPEQSS